MKMIKFLKTLNNKIKKLDKMAPKTNPFTMPKYLTLVWIEDPEQNYFKT